MMFLTFYLKQAPSGDLRNYGNSSLLHFDHLQFVTTSLFSSHLRAHTGSPFSGHGPPLSLNLPVPLNSGPWLFRLSWLKINFTTYNQYINENTYWRPIWCPNSWAHTFSAWPMQYAPTSTIAHPSVLHASPSRATLHPPLTFPEL